jgi:3-oxoadipate enol-lactonase
MPFADLPDVRLHYRFDGPEEAPVVVLANSLGTDLGMWSPQVATLANSFRVLRYDKRGHGRSGVPAGPYTISQLGTDVVHLLDALGIPRAHFCGLSIGGCTGMWLGVHAPQRVDRLVLCNTAAKIGTPELWNARIDAVRKGGMAAIVDAVLARWFTPDYLAGGTPELAAVRVALERTPAEGYVGCCAAVRDMDQRTSIPAIRAPTLVITGAHDLATPAADGRGVAHVIPHANYVELAAGHLSNIEAAAAFTTALVAHLGGAARRPPA